MSPSLRNARRALLVIASLAWVSDLSAQTRPLQGAPLPRPRVPAASERSEMARTVGRLGQQVPGNAEYRAAGVFRFTRTDDFTFMERTDLNSMAFESSRYGADNLLFDSAKIGREELLRRIDKELERFGWRSGEKRFARFQDEFVGATQPKGLSIEIDPRTVRRHVARTAVFERFVDGVPVFGSELVVGLMPDGRIGRLRVHWPQIRREMFERARELQRRIEDKKFVPPASMRTKDVEILSVTAGVAHSAFASPGFAASPVIRVAFRQSSGEPPYRLQTTGYKYFDISGREISFSSFPALPETPASSKRSAPKK